MQKVISFLVIALILIVLTSQTKAPNTKSKSPAISDTTKVISIRDIQSFNAFLKQAASYEQYTKLTPEMVLDELIKWKQRELADTTKLKK